MKKRMALTRCAIILMTLLLIGNLIIGSLSSLKRRHRARRRIQMDLQTQVSFSLAEDRSALWVEPVSWLPRAFLFHNILSRDDCEHLIKQTTNLERSRTETSTRDDGRTSRGGWISLSRSLRDERIAEMKRSVALLTGIPESSQELIQILRYEPGQYYKTHIDFGVGAKRIFTMLFYLTDVQEGGETHFPLAIPADPKWTTGACAGQQGGVAVRPKKGDALLFYNMGVDSNSVVNESMHESCTVTKGEKWSATVWGHQS